MSKEEPLKAYLEEKFSYIDGRLTKVEKGLEAIVKAIVQYDATVGESFKAFGNLISEYICEIRKSTEESSRHLKEEVEILQKLADRFEESNKESLKLWKEMVQSVQKLNDGFEEWGKRFKEFVETVADEEEMDIIFDKISRKGVELSSLLKVLKSENDIGEDNALRLIEQLKKENLIYEPEKGYLKRKPKK